MLTSKPLQPGKIPVAIVGANGYAGVELARLLLKHPRAELVGCFGRNSEWSLSDELLGDRAARVPTFSIEKLQVDGLQKEIGQLSTVFLATPPEVSIELAPLILRSGAQVIDLSGAFRLSEVPYGLVPWRGVIAGQQQAEPLISNPGCYATSVLMALIPLLKEGVIESDGIVIDAKSGTTGAGRKPQENLLFSEVEGSCMPYRVGKHQHIPEIKRYIQMFAGVDISPHFSTSLLPVGRGIISSIYAKLKSSDREHALHAVESAYQNAYQNYPLLKFGKLGQSPARDKMLLSLKSVSGSSRTHISYTADEDRLYVFSCIDNLLKGAAGQALENWNQAHGFPIETGLAENEGWV